MKKINFPYKKYFMFNPEYYYNNIVNYEPVYLKTNKYYRDDDKKYYYDFMITCKHQYYNIDTFTDYFNEKQRMKAKVKHERYSPYEYYKINEREINNKFKNIKSNKIRIEEMNDYIYSSIKQATLFKISTVISCFKYIEKDLNINLNNIKVLDPSSGWGDRLIGCMCLNVDEYTGYDPNETLQKGYNKIIKTIGKIINRKNNQDIDFKSKFKVICDGFENSNYNNYFDVVFTSPPYFDVEEYIKNDKQSIVKYNTFDKWKNEFFKTYLKKCIESVKVGGLIFLHISNNREFKIVNFLFDEMNKYNVKKYKYIGIAGYTHELPIWSWIKTK